MILEPWTAEVWQRVRDAGKFNKVHAGEFMGPDFVWKAIDELKVTQLDHGVRAVEDPALVERLVRDRVGLDPGSLYILGATVVLKSREGERKVPIENFFTEVKQSVLRPDGLLRAVRFPAMNKAGRCFSRSWGSAGH